MVAKDQILKTVEEIRQSTLAQVLKFTGLTLREVTVEINLHPENSVALANEAEARGWYRDSNEGSSWYTSVKPDDGGTFLFLD